MTAILNTLNLLAEQEDLPAELMRQAMRELIAGHANPIQVGAFLMALRIKGESATEIAAAAEVMREVVVRVEVDPEGLTDIVGTGGDNSSLFNVSTASTFVAAAAGVRMAKHGGRSISSKSGAADVLETFGCRIDLDGRQTATLIDELGVAFLFAPKFHTAMLNATEPRRALAMRTVFNLLGPLTNPAFAPNQLLGVFSDRLVLPFAQVLQKLGSRHVLVVHSHDGLDEISPAAPTRAAELKNGEIREIEIRPADYGMSLPDLAPLRVDGTEQSLELVRAALSGQPCPAARIVALNAGAAIYVSGQVDTLADGVARAREVLASGAGLQRFEDYARRTREL